MNYYCPYSASWKGNHVMETFMQINIALLNVIGDTINPDECIVVIILKLFLFEYRINEMLQIT